MPEYRSWTGSDDRDGLAPDPDRCIWCGALDSVDCDDACLCGACEDKREREAERRQIAKAGTAA